MKIAIAGGSGYDTIAKVRQHRHGKPPTYHTDTLSKNPAGGQRMQQVDKWLYPHHDVTTMTAKPLRFLRLRLEYFDHRESRIATLELDGERIFKDIYAGPPLIFLKSDLNEFLNVRSSRMRMRH